MAREEPSETWTLEALRLHLEDEITWLKERVSDDDRRIHELLVGFPQQYSTKEEVKEARMLAEDVRAHLVGREAFEDLKAQVDRRFADARTAADQGKGRHAAFQLVTGFVLALVLGLTGFVLNTIPSHSEIQQQIAVEAPWMTDRPTIENRLDQLEQQVQALNVQVKALQIQNRFFCQTRTKAGLPGC